MLAYTEIFYAIFQRQKGSLMGQKLNNFQKITLVNFKEGKLKG